MNVTQTGRGSRGSFEVFLPGAEIGMCAEIVILFARRRHETVPPQQDPVGEIGKLRAGLRIDEIPGPGEREIEAEFLAAGSGEDPARLLARCPPRRPQVEV